jgi:cellulose synthase/poly-beta-1,6-N-acetylglucosamine synthase-like glycosyltransferase
MKPVEIAFVLTCLVYIYPYLIYPAVLALLARVQEPRTGLPTIAPKRISHIICAHNEEEYIGPKLLDVLGAGGGLESEVILVCDGCTDRTAKIAHGIGEQYADLKVMETSHIGKSAAQNVATAEAKGDVLVLSDADTVFCEKAVGLMLESIRRGYSCVGANVRYGRPGTPASIYSRLEARLKTLQGRLGILIGVHGPCYAVRKEAFRKHDSSVLSDLALPLDLLLEGGAVGFEQEAVVQELTDRSRFSRNLATRRRIFCRALTTLFRRGYLARSTRAPGLFFHLVSDKILRYFIGILSLLAVVLAAFAGGWALYAVLIAAGSVALTALAGTIPGKLGRWATLSAASMFFITVNLASLLALSDYLTSKDYSRW